MKRPIGVSLISYFYLFGAVVLLVTSVFYDPNANSIGMADRFGLPDAPERLVRVCTAFLSLGMIYGYMRLKKWGFWLMITYSVVFGFISSILVSNQSQQPFFGNMLFSVVVIVYTIYVRKNFLQTYDQGEQVKEQ